VERKQCAEPAFALMLRRGIYSVRLTRDDNQKEGDRDYAREEGKEKAERSHCRLSAKPTEAEVKPVVRSTRP